MNIGIRHYRVGLLEEEQPIEEGYVKIRVFVEDELKYRRYILELDIRKETLTKIKKILNEVSQDG